MKDAIAKVIKRLQPNRLIIVGVLLLLQIYLLGVMNGEIADIIKSHDTAILATILSPTAGILWTLRNLASPDDEA